MPVARVCSAGRLRPPLLPAPAGARLPRQGDGLGEAAALPRWPNDTARRASALRQVPVRSAADKSPHDIALPAPPGAIELANFRWIEDAVARLRVHRPGKHRVFNRLELVPAPNQLLRDFGRDWLKSLAVQHDVQ